MSQSAPRRAATQDAERRNSKSPAQELKRKMATATVVVEKDSAFDKRCEANGDREAKEKPTEGKSKAEAKLGEPARHVLLRNGDDAHTRTTHSTHNGKTPSAAAAADVPTQNAARPEGTEIPPNTKQSKQQEGDKAKSDKDAKKEDKNSAKKEEKEKDTKKEDKKAADKTEKETLKKDDKKAADKAEKEALKKEDKKAATKEDKAASKTEDKKAATNGDESNSQESGERRKPDTNYSVSRVKISPYRRGRSGDKPNDNTLAGNTLADNSLLADNTLADNSLGDCSTRANYAGNNSTMECDLSVGSRSETATPARGASGLRSLRGRASYRALGELSLSLSSRDSGCSRPTAPVVGRKRPAPTPAPAHYNNTDNTTSHSLTPTTTTTAASLLKRPRLAQMVGINSDLPLCGAAGTELESLKPAGCSSSVSNSSATSAARDRRCRIM